MCEHCVTLPTVKHVEGDKHIKGVIHGEHVKNMTGNKHINTGDM